MKGKLIGACVSLVAGVVVMTPGAAAAAGPNQEVFEASPAFACEAAAGLPPYHCINTQGQGTTGVIKVFAPDPRGPQESISFAEKADARPCPHDPGADADGTWWQVGGPGGPYVCHHRP